jgi:phosphate transport system permease protein
MSQIEQTGGGNGKGYVPAYRRDRRTKRSVLIADLIANNGITVGGILVIVAVFAIMVFLLVEAFPLFAGGKVESHAKYQLAPMPNLVAINADEYKTIGLRVSADGKVDSFHLPTGATLQSQDLGFGGKRATAVGTTLERNDVVFGFDDGTVRFGRIAPKVDILTPQDVPGSLRKIGSDLTDGTAVFRPIPGDQVRRISLDLSLDEPQKVSDAGVAIVAIDYRLGGTVERPTRSFVSVDARGTVRLSRGESQRNLLTGKEKTTVRSVTLPDMPAGTKVSEILLTGQADQVFVASESAVVYRYDTRDFGKPTLAEVAKLLPDGVMLTTMGFLNGNQTLVIGGSDGSVNNYFRLQRDDAKTADGYKVVLARQLEPQKAPVTQFTASQRRKSFATGDEQGNIWYRHATSETVEFRLDRGSAVTGASLLLTPRDDGIVAIDSTGTVNLWSIYLPHPETGFQAIFGKLWYEGYPEPSYTWQSSSGTDIFEPKFSLVPLIFGTIKATVYSLIFAIPISLMAAIYTSEFLHSRVRASVKPVMEMMESLPTVVLGFVAALILAPIVENWIGAVMLAFVAMPMSLMAAAYLWQILPRPWVQRLQGIPKFVLFFAVVFLGAYIAYTAGPAFEEVFFYGDLKAWANHDVGTGTPFMFLLLLPLAFFAVSYSFYRTALGIRFRNSLRALDPSRAGMLDAARWISMLVAASLLSLAVAALLTAVGFDPRGSVVDTYVQRNALVVGFVMGFAVIPNIYTLAEDALNAVPSSIRAASLAAGATPWQTAIWVVLPTALSGVFAAVMIGMGRAVGETMIVVMAAGNTPVLEWNVFNGLRTLSANIAVELPEAVQNGTLYRMLFFAALTLFLMTFCINTVAEIIRQRFRKRAFQL